MLASAEWNGYSLTFTRVAGYDADPTHTTKLRKHFDCVQAGESVKRAVLGATARPSTDMVGKDRSAQYAIVANAFERQPDVASLNRRIARIIHYATQY